MANKRRDVEKARFWRRTISAQRGSGLSVRAFCARERLSEPSFYAWRRTLAQRAGATTALHTRVATRRPRRSRTPAFVSLVAGGAAPLRAGLVGADTALELVHPRGHVLRIGPGCDRTTLSMVLSALAADHDEAPRC